MENYLIQVWGLIIVGNEAQNHSIISKCNNRRGAVRGNAVVCVERVEQGVRTQPCGAPTFRVMELEVNWPTFTTWGLPVRKSRIQSQSEEFRPRSPYRWGLLYWKLSYSQWIAALHSFHVCCQCVWGKSAGPDRWHRQLIYLGANWRGSKVTGMEE